MKRIIPIILVLLLLVSACAPVKDESPEVSSFVSRFDTEHSITISDEEIKSDGETVGENGDVYVSHDIIYYENKDSYDSGNPYGEGGDEDKHSAEEAAAHTVLNITKSGAYRISGKLSAGQIRVDLGEDAPKDPDAVVELILDQADITCTVAPAIVFMNVYECDADWTVEDADYLVDTSGAGAVLVLADGSVNKVSGSYVEKIFKDQEEEKKLWKQDGAVYSYMSMNICGGGTLNVTAENEGLGTELHLSVNGGNINISSQNDGINTNEDNVSVTTINGGVLSIMAGLGAEGDGIDSNGWLVINGGCVVSNANPKADSGLDSDKGIYINGGTVLAFGSNMDRPAAESKQPIMNLQFLEPHSNADAIVIRNEKDEIVFAYRCENDEVMQRKSGGAVISCPELLVNGNYTVYAGGTLTGEETSGIYDVKTVTEYTDGTQLAHYGTGGGRGDRMPGNPPEFDGEMPPMPEGERPPEFNGERPERPEGQEGEPPKMPPDGEMPEGMMPPMLHFNNFDGSQQQTVFTMKDTINVFLGVAAVQ